MDVPYESAMCGCTSPVPGRSSGESSRCTVWPSTYVRCQGAAQRQTTKGLIARGRALHCIAVLFPLLSCCIVHAGTWLQEPGLAARRLASTARAVALQVCSPGVFERCGEVGTHTLQNPRGPVQFSLAAFESNKAAADPQDPCCERSCG